MKFDYVMVVPTIREAEYHARELGLKREEFKYCVNEGDIAGFRLPTNKLLFTSENLYEEMSYLSKEEETFYYKLHDRFDKILHLFGKELSPKIDVSHKAVFGKKL